MEKAPYHDAYETKNGFEAQKGEAVEVGYKLDSSLWNQDDKDSKSVDSSQESQYSIN